MLNNLRNILFWTIDTLTGSKKKSNFQDIQSLLENVNSTTSTKRKKEYLDAILQHAIGTVPYYKNTKPLITAFPVINKNIFRENFKAFQSESFQNEKKRTVSTSGSTGTPFTVHQDISKIIRNTSDNLYFWEKAGYNIGDKLFFFRLWNAFEKKKSFINFAQNVVPIDVFDLTPPFIENLLKNIQKGKGNICLLGYVSAFEKICKHLDSTNPNFRSNAVKSIIAISEKLNEYTKESTRKYFGITPISRYSNIENGIIAQQPKDKDYFVINEASYYIEILNLENDEQQQNGALGRIVITDLFNKYNPMIRYDTGDLGMIEEIDNKKVLTQITGRKIDAITNTNGEIITFNIVLIVNKYLQLAQCQLIQTNQKHYILKLNALQNFERENELIADFKNYLGNDAVIKVEYVSEIPLLASGKRRVMVNQMM
ncbi:phenylacetate--CoA ligase family protein [uncultured Aquimarina sp.]|uniref:CoF synthetase n=1 Tax=uncultured Aquimarina sp. TaxID=575652 RepID=UPI00260C062B|nr:CoF synthetase [uncultured Aquimarina sp.]